MDIERDGVGQTCGANPQTTLPGNHIRIHMDQKHPIPDGCRQTAKIAHWRVDGRYARLMENHILIPGKVDKKIPAVLSQDTLRMQLINELRIIHGIRTVDHALFIQGGLNGNGRNRMQGVIKIEPSPADDHGFSDTDGIKMAIFFSRSDLHAG